MLAPSEELRSTRWHTPLSIVCSAHHWHVTLAGCALPLGVFGVQHCSGVNLHVQTTSIPWAPAIVLAPAMCRAALYSLVSGSILMEAAGAACAVL